MMMTALRIAACAIALVAVVDPAITSARSSRPLVAIVTSDPARHEALSNRVARELAREFTVVRGVVGSAAGTVLVGNAVPDDGSPLAAPLIAVLPARRTPALRIVAVKAPVTSSLNTRIPVDVRVSTAGAAGQRVEVELLRDGVILDRKSVDISSDTATADVTLAFVPPVVGTSALGVRAFIPGSSAADQASTAVRATDERFPVLFFDQRASWATTFVRRALERDPRFAVAHRLLTSRGVSNTAGATPASLRDPEALSGYETVVVGVPEQLTEADVAGIDAFMRARGGRVVLIMDRRVAAPIDRLTRAGSWRAARLPAAGPLDDRAGHGTLKAQEIAWPAATPSGATIHSASIGRDSTARAVVWSVPVGAGRMLVSGALDAWHYRDPATSAFDSFWTNQIAELSASAPPTVDANLSRSVLRPGESAVVRVKVRDAVLRNRANRSASVSALLVSGNDSTLVRLWPEAMPGAFSGRIVAPPRSGRYRLIVSSGGEQTEAPIVVDSAAPDPARDDDADIVRAFVSSRGGISVPETDLRDLSSRVSAALQPVSRVETWHPMRSAWWIVPFALLLGAEWWWRRRRGLA